jgi:MFS transporter, SHS family, lactate transporter
MAALQYRRRGSVGEAREREAGNMAAVETVNNIPWWREPTRDQWYAWWAAWLGWTLDAFDFTVFLLIIKPIADEFHVSTAEVAIVFTLTLWMRLVGAVASGWLADRIGRKTPLMISIFWYSICNFIAGFSPTFVFLLIFRTLLGIGMGAEWPAGAALAMEQWPIRSRGFMSGVLQGSWSIGFLLSSVIYGLFFDYIGWRGMLWVGVLPALSIVYVRYFVKEPEVWVENRRQQRATHREVRAPLIKIFQRAMLGNTLLACWWMASNFVLYYSIWSLFATHLQQDLKLTAMGTAVPFMLANILSFLGMCWWGWTADIIGRRWAMMIPAAIAIPIAPLYLFTGSEFWITIGFGLQGAFGGALYSQLPSYLAERFPTEVRATASAFCYHQGAIFGGLVAPILAFFAVNFGVGYAIPMLVGTVVAAASVVVSLLLSPETKGTVLVAELQVA